MFNRENKIVLQDDFGNKYVLQSDGSVESVNGCFLKNVKQEPNAYGNNSYRAYIDIKNNSPLVLNLHDGNKLKFINNDVPNNEFPMKIVFEKYISREGNRKIRLHSFNANTSGDYIRVKAYDNQTHDFGFTSINGSELKMNFFYNSNKDKKPLAITCHGIGGYFVLGEPFEQQHNAEYLFVNNKNEYYMLDHSNGDLSKYHRDTRQDEFQQQWQVKIKDAMQFCGCNEKTIDMLAYDVNSRKHKIIRLDKRNGSYIVRTNVDDENDVSKIMDANTSEIFKNKTFKRKDIIQEVNDVQCCNCCREYFH